IHPTGRLAALVGNPNAGKTALFNRLTGSHQKVANYAGVTIERKEGRLVLGIRRMGLPCVVALNMADLAASRGIKLDSEALSRELGVPVVSTVAVHGEGDVALRQLLEQPDIWKTQGPPLTQLPGEVEAPDHEAVRAILQRLGLDDVAPHLAS